jgi:uncharacterized damage-inducible protein DinB
MSTTTEPLVEELQAEAETTRRMLDRVPEGKLGWRPHPKSMTLGQLALHTAQVPGNLCGLLSTESFDASQANFEPAQPASKVEILAGLDAGLAHARQYLGGLDDAQLGATWALTNGGEPVFALPRVKLIRSLVFNHWYHHRGQLSVYLRLLDVPVPISYGRSADESPF